MFSPPIRRFFKPVLPNFHQGLTIPPEHISKYLDFLSNEGDESEHDAVLKTECGEWKVKIKGCRFEDGWPEFAEHHDLRVGYFLVFEHDEGNLVFQVSVYVPNACRRQYYNFVNPKTEMPLPNNNNNNKEKKKKMKKKTKCSVPPKEGASSSSSTRPSFQAVMYSHSITRSEFNIPQDFARLHGLCNRGSVMMTIIEGDHPEKRSWPVMMRETTSDRIYLSTGWADFRVANALCEGDYLSFTLTENGEKPVMVFNKIKKNCGSKKNKPNEVAANTSNCFTSVIYDTTLNRCGLHVPAKIVKSNGLSKDSQVTMIDPEQREWKVGVRCIENNSARIQVGWKYVTSANKLEIGDEVKSELVKTGENTFEIYLSILGRSSQGRCVPKAKKKP